jgi:hypothetical protein
MTVRFQDKSLRNAFRDMMADGKITKDEVKTLVDATKDTESIGDAVLDRLGRMMGRDLVGERRVSDTEKKDLKNLLDQLGDAFETDAKADLKKFLGIADTAPPPATDPSTPGTPTTPTDPATPGTGATTPGADLDSRVASTITDPAEIAGAFKSELSDRSAEFSRPEDAFALFSQYGEALKKLTETMEPEERNKLIGDLLEAGRSSPAAGYDAKDTDFDTRSDLDEAARGQDPKAFTERDEEVGKIWSTTYWPMAGSAGNPDGETGSHLWATGGALDKLDQLLKTRGEDSQAKALEFERKPALNWLIGERSNRGHYIPDSNLSETDAERTTGVDFDGDGKITDGVKVDFLGHDGGFAAVYNRNQLIPKATIGGETVEVRRERETDADGNITFKFFNKTSGAELAGPELESVFYANPSSDGKADNNMDVGWWGSCDKVALAGVLFKEPIKDEVTVDGVTFTKQDMLGFLTVIANSQAAGTDFVGARYDDRPDVVSTTDGRRLVGKLVDVSDNVFKNANFRRTDGDILNVSDPFADEPNKELTFRTLEGEEIALKGSEIRSMAREDEADVSPMKFHTTMLQWLSEGKAAAIDRDSGDHVWNYSFHGATLKSGEELKGDARPDFPGHNGPIGDDTKIVRYTMDVRFGESDWPREYEYFLEFDGNGNAVNGGWYSDNPDFLWRPAGFRDFTGRNDRNPYVKPELVKEIYDKFMEQ